MVRPSLRADIADDADAALGQTFGHTIETCAAAVEDNVVEFTPGDAEDVADDRGALRLPEPQSRDVRLGQTGKSMRRQRRKIEAFGRFRDKCEGQRFHGSRSFNG